MLLRTLRGPRGSTVVARVLAVLVVLGLLATVSPWLVASVINLVGSVLDSAF